MNQDGRVAYDNGEVVVVSDREFPDGPFAAIVKSHLWIADGSGGAQQLIASMHVLELRPLLAAVDPKEVIVGSRDRITWRSGVGERQGGSRAFVAM